MATTSRPESALHPLLAMPSIRGEAMSIIPVVVATMLGFFLGGFEAAAAAAAALAVGGVGAAVVLGRRMWATSEASFVQWEVELAGGLRGQLVAEAEELAEDEAWEAEVAEWQAAAAAEFERRWEAARRRWWSERVRGRGG